MRFPSAILLVRCSSGHAQFARPGEDEDHCPCGLKWVIVAALRAHEFASGNLIGLPSIPPPGEGADEEDDDEA